MEDKVMFVVAIIIIIAMIIATIFFELTPVGRKIWEDYEKSREQKSEESYVNYIETLVRTNKFFVITSQVSWLVITIDRGSDI